MNALGSFLPFIHTESVFVEMNALGSPLDALDYLSFGFLPVINNIWAWVAVLTAAVSFWRIRAGTVTKSDIFYEISPPMVSLPHHGEEEEAVSKPGLTLTTTLKKAPLVASRDTTEGATKGKFTLYYEGGSEGDMASSGVVDDDDGVGKRGEDYWCDNSAKVMKMRIGNDMGWYRYQDLTVLDGNVVRLWRGCREKVPLFY